jgi:hypothetical protein
MDKPGVNETVACRTLVVVPYKLWVWDGCNLAFQYPMDRWYINVLISYHYNAFLSPITVQFSKLMAKPGVHETFFLPDSSSGSI